MRSLILLFSLSMLFAGCGTLDSDAPPDLPPSANPPQYVGQVATVNPEAKFLLIDISGFQPPAAGTDLVIRHKGEVTARLRVSAEARRPFVVADILSGNPETGESVWFQNRTP